MGASVQPKYRPLYALGKRPRHSLMMGQVGPQVRYGRFRDEVNLLFSLGSEQLCRLLYRRS